MIWRHRLLQLFRCECPAAWVPYMVFSTCSPGSDDQEWHQRG